MSVLECAVCDAAVNGVAICPRCTSQLQVDLIRAALAVRDLRRSYLRQDVRGGQSGSHQKAKYTPLPWSESAHGVLADLEAALRPHGHGQPEETAMQLAARGSRLALNAELGPLAAALPALLRRADAVTDRRAETWVYGPCATCGTLLEDEVTAKSVSCQCGATYDAEELRLKQWAAVDGCLVTQAEAAKLLHLRMGAPAETARLNINRWVSRGLIADQAGYVLFGECRTRWIKGTKMRALKAARSEQGKATKQRHAA